jgi:general secretion pathway protein F
MIALSAFVRDFGLLSILVILAAGLGLNRLAQRPAIAGQLDRLVLRLPLIGRLQRNLQAARLARTLSALIGAGTPVLEGLRAARETVRNAVMRKALDEGAEAVAQGKGLAPALRATETFPPLVIYMAAMGERTGTLAPMLDKSADYLEGELDAAVSTAMSLLEPGIIVVMGALVATIVLAIFLPILRFNAMAL